MTKRIVTAFITALLISPLAIAGCKKAETTRATIPQTPPRQTHEREMLKKSFEESKKVTAAKVNGEPITEFSLLREMNTIAPLYLTGGRKRTPELDAKIRKDALNTLVIQELAVQEARKLGMRIKPEVIDSEIKRIKADKGSGTAYAEYLAMNGFTEEELRKAIENDALFELIAGHEIDAKITVTDAALRKRYEKEKSSLVTKEAPQRQMTFEEARGLLEQKIRAEAGEKRMREWEKELKKNARIEVMKQNQP